MNAFGALAKAVGTKSWHDDLGPGSTAHRLHSWRGVCKELTKELAKELAELVVRDNVSLQTTADY
jgi:hypothetical protein